MDRLVQEVLAETELLLSISEEDVDYTRYEALVEKRQQLIDHFGQQQDVSADNKTGVQRLLEHDHAIVERMRRVKAEAQKGLLRLQGYRKQKNAYDHYDSVEGFMYDKRK